MRLIFQLVLFLSLLIVVILIATSICACCCYWYRKKKRNEAKHTGIQVSADESFGPCVVRYPLNSVRSASKVTEGSASVTTPPNDGLVKGSGYCFPPKKQRLGNVRFKSDGKIVTISELVEMSETQTGKEDHHDPHSVNISPLKLPSTHKNDAQQEPAVCKQAVPTSSDKTLKTHTSSTTETRQQMDDKVEPSKIFKIAHSRTSRHVKELTVRRGEFVEVLDGTFLTSYCKSLKLIV